MALSGQFRPIGTMVRVAALSLVQERFYSGTVVDDTLTPKQQHRQRFQEFKRALEHAQKKQLLGMEGDFVWPFRVDRQEDDQSGDEC